MYSGGLSSRRECVSSLFGRLVAVTFDDPPVVVSVPKLKECEAQVFDGTEVSNPQEVFFEGTDEPLGASVAFWLTHETRRCLDAEECDLVLEVVRDVL